MIEDMIKRIFVYIYILCLCVLTACVYHYNEPEMPAAVLENEYQRFSEFFLDVFDTVTIVSGYAKTQEEFDYFSKEVIRAELHRLHQLFDIFNEYPEINNMRTINNNAGILPVEVDPVIIEMLKLCIEAYHMTNGVVNIALGPVIDLWRKPMALGAEPAVPDMSILLAANKLTNIHDVIIDEEKNTVFLRYEGMLLDVGSIAKGFAVELAAQKAIDAGFDSFILTVGGDVRVASAPRSGARDTWGVGIESPIAAGEMIDAVFVTDTSVFSSGDFQRYFIVDGVRYHHIIDPRTLMPAVNYRSVAVIYPDGGMADVLSTAAFILDIDEAKDILANFGAEAIWVLQDGDIKATDGFNKIRIDSIK